MANTEQTALLKSEEQTTIAAMEKVQTDIKSLIYVIRNQQVMIDSDLAMLYQVETKRLNEAVKRNIARFPEEFRFQLTEEEAKSLRSQIATSNNMPEEDGKKGGRRYLPYVFTEQIFEYISEHEETNQKVFFDGQIYDAFSLIVSLIQKAEKEITLIDGYVT